MCCPRPREWKATEYKMYGNRKQVLMHVFHCDLRMDVAHECNTDEANYLKTF